MSRYVPGKAPACPVQSPVCLGVIADRGAKQCAACYHHRSKQARHARLVNQAGATGGVETISAPSKDVLEITKPSTEQVRTLEDLIRVCEIDTETWTIDRWVCNKWDMGSVDAKKQARTTPLFQIKVWLKRRVVKLAIEAEIAQLKALAKQRIKRPRLVRSPTAGDAMLELSIYDLHAGKLAWAPETGHSNYDTHIARQYFEQALETLISRTRGHQFCEIVLVCGNDLFNSDSPANTTTRGTAQDTDGRFHKTFAAVRTMIIRAIERCSLIAPVIVPIVPGNHDTLTAWHLGDSLECYFHGDPRICILNDPTMRKYHRFGQVMLMFTHGDTGKRADYPQVMAAEQKAMWGSTTYREAHVGHFHKTQVEEYHGVRVRILSALCPPDAWHASMQFVGNQQAAEAFVWSATEGLIAQATYTVPETLKAAA